MSFDFRLKTHLKVGANESLQLPTYLHELGLERIGVVIDSKIVNLPAIVQVIDSLNHAQFFGVKIWQYDLPGEPDYDSLDRVKMLFLKDNQEPLVDCFVALGGGSVMDFAKGLATLCTNPGEARQYKGFPKNINQTLPVIALPTVAGTGSEVTFNASFIDWNSKKKMGINSYNNFPVLAILDPVLSADCPLTVTVSSGMDGLVHTFESYAATKSNELTRLFSREAFYYLFHGLLKIVKTPNDLVVRVQLLLGAYLAGTALMNSGSGPAGALSYPLGVHFRVPHGTAGAVFLPHLIAHNVKLGFDYSELYDRIEGADFSLSKEKKNQLLVEKMFTLGANLSMPTHLNSFGVNADNLSLLINEVDSLTGAFAQNPVPFTAHDGKKLLEQMIIH